MGPGQKEKRNGMSEWCTIESDPGVFTELLEGMQVSGVQVEEIYSLEDGLEDFKPVYGLIFLFKWEKEKEARTISETEDVYFAKQMVPNACATQALVSVLMNNDTISLGPELTEFKTITLSFSAEMKGLAIGNQNLIRETHNSFSRPEPFTIVQSDSGKGEAYHFIAYVPVRGHLYELDGLQDGPIDLGECSNDNWLQKVTPVIQARMSQQSTSYNLMAVIKNKKLVYQEEIDVFRETKAALQQELTSLEGEAREKAQAEIAVLTEKIENLIGKIAGEEAKFAMWKAENIRRKHNYIPFLFNLLKVLAENNLLVPLVDRAKEKQKQRQAQSQDKK